GQYALSACEQGELIYALQPVAPARLQTTCERLRARHTRAPQDIGAQLAELGALLKQGGAARQNYLKWIQAQVGGSLRMVSTREVLFFQADDKYTCVQTATAQLLIRKT